LIAHRSIVSIGFKLSGVLVGAPAVAACVALAIGALDLQHDAAPDGSHMLSVHTYGIAGLLTDAGVGLDHVFGFFAGFAAWLLAALAILALIVALAGVLVYLVGRGVGRRALWARIVGGLFALGLALTSLIAFANLPPRLMAAPLPTMAIALYTLWTLIWRFNARTLAAPQAEAVAEIGP
jgi:hypothetical protein